MGTLNEDYQSPYRHLEAGPHKQEAGVLLHRSRCFVIRCKNILFYRRRYFVNSVTMAWCVLKVANGRDGFCMWRVAAIILYKQSLAANIALSFSLEDVRRTEKSSP